MLAAFLREKVHPAIWSVDAVEIEYAEPDELSPLKLLGEEGGSRGSGQTSPDLAFIVNNRTGLLLIENKLTEHSFYPCSARKARGSNARPLSPDIKRCLDAVAVSVDPLLCHQQTWGRKYWGILSKAVIADRFKELKCCPGAIAGYQLLRQQALAEGIAQSNKYQFVMSCLALDQRNESLFHCLRSTGIEDVRDWGQLFHGAANFGVFTHQDWVEWVRAHDEQFEWTDWSAWVKRRYAI